MAHKEDPSKATEYGEHGSVSNMPIGDVQRRSPLVEGGRIGDKVAGVTPRLHETGLDLVARRVLAKRGIETSDPAALHQLKTLRGAGRNRILRDVVDQRTGQAFLPPAGALVAETVIGTDTRTRVFDTAHYPYSAIAMLEITAADGQLWLGTGWFVSPRTVITAGHCVFIRDAASPSGNGWVQSITVIPGRNGPGLLNTNEPFGSISSSQFRTRAEWVNTGDPGFDYAAILLPEGSPNGSQVGTFGIGAYDDGELTGFNLNVAGYPADKLPEDTMWFDAKMTRAVTQNRVFYDVETTGGESGSPVYVANGDERIAVAIHAYGTTASVNDNSGTRINADVYNTILSWKT